MPGQLLRDCTGGAMFPIWMFLVAAAFEVAHNGVGPDRVGLTRQSEFPLQRS